jgi:predicted enzyme related to lactoylglutathione lyase
LNFLGEGSSTDASSPSCMEGKITHFALLVENKADSLAFDTKKVGFEKKADFTSPEGYRWVTVGPKRQELELVLTQPGSADDVRPASVTTLLDDCRMASEALKAGGVKFIQEPKENQRCVSAISTGPDGNIFQMNQFHQRGS